MQWSERIGRRIKLRDLHILTEVVQSGGMAKAAKRLAISTPVISKAIADLERAVGVRLLDRGAQGVDVTMYGRALLRWSASAFDDLRQGVKEIEFLSDPTAGELRIGCTDAMAAGFLPAVISRLHRHHTRLIFHVSHAISSAVLYRELRERNVDLILGRITMPTLEADLSADILFDEPLLVVAGSRSRWPRRRKIELADLISEPWMLPPADTAAGALIRQTFQACGLESPRGAVVSASVQMHNTLLANGPYLAMRPASMLRFGAKAPWVKVLPVKLPALPRPVGIITLKGRMTSPATQLFIDCAREVGKPLAR